MRRARPPKAKAAEAPRQREEQAEQLAFDIRRFVKHLENRDFASPEEVKPLKRSTEEPRRFSKEVPKDLKKQRELLKVVRRLRNKLEAEYEAKLAAKKLFAAQREECPPRYRRLVNKYYEALAKAKK